MYPFAHFSGQYCDSVTIGLSSFMTLLLVMYVMLLLLLLLLLLFTIHLFPFSVSSFPSLFLPSSVPSSSLVFSLPLASSSVFPFLLSLLLLLCLFSLFPRLFHLFSLFPLLPRLPLSCSAFSSSCPRFHSSFLFFFFPFPLCCFPFSDYGFASLPSYVSSFSSPAFFSSSCFFFCAYLFFSHSFCSSSSFHSSLSSSFCSLSFLFFFGSFFSSSTVSSSCLIFRYSFLFACSASLVSAPPFPSAPVEPPHGFFQLRALFLRLQSLPLLSLQLPRSPRCPPLLPSPFSGHLQGSPIYLLCPPLLFLLLRLWEVSWYSHLRCSSLRTFRHWFVGLWPTGVRLFALILLFASLLSFLVFVLTLLMVLLAFYLLCLSLL